MIKRKTRIFNSMTALILLFAGNNQVHAQETVEFLQNQCYEVSAARLDGSGSWQAGQNYGDEYRLSLGENRLTVFGFDISNLPANANINGVEFRMYQKSDAWFAGAFSVELRLMTESFDEAAVTWNSHGDGYDTTAAGILSVFNNTEEHFLEGSEYLFSSTQSFIKAADTALAKDGMLYIAVKSDKFLWPYSDDVNLYPPGLNSPKLSITYNGEPMQDFSITGKSYRGIGGIEIEPACGPYKTGDIVTITAVPDEGYVFDQWVTGVDEAQKTTNPVSITVSGDTELVANFRLVDGIPTQRDRVGIMNSTVVSDKGTRLRGCYVDTYYWKDDQSEILEGTKDSIMVLADHYGFNALHFYAGSKEDSTGKYLEIADSLVKWTRQANLYLIMCIGGGRENGTFSINKVRDFWNLYAPRYAQETHVIYEVQNEPEFNCLQASAQATMDMEIEAYNLIRSYAPETHIILMSYGMINRYFDDDIAVLENAGIDLKTGNASISYHGYHWCAKARQNPPYPGGDELSQVKPLKDQGYVFLTTEFEADSTLEGSYEYDGMLLDFYENVMEISWTMFWPIPGNSINHSFKDRVDEVEISWCPDFGTWPQNSAICATANYYNLATAVSGMGTIEISPGGYVHEEGKEISLTAQAGEGYVFDHWTGDVPAGSEEDNPLTVTMNSDISVNAVFSDNSTDVQKIQSGKFEVFPNPVKKGNDFIIKINGMIPAGNTTINICNVTGRSVYSEMVHPLKTCILKHTIPGIEIKEAGIYFVSVRNNNMVETLLIEIE